MTTRRSFLGAIAAGAGAAFAWRGRAHEPIPSLSLGQILEVPARITALETFDGDLYIGTEAGLYRTDATYVHLPRHVLSGHVRALSKGVQNLYVGFDRSTYVICPRRNPNRR